MIAVLLCVASMAVLSACGGSSDSAGGSTSSTAGDSSSTAGSSTSPPTTKSSSDGGGEPSAEFAGKGQNGELATAGKESSVEEREAASKVVEASFVARAAGDWAGQCETLAAPLVKGLEKAGSKGILKGSCPATLETMAGKAPKAALENTMVEPLAAVRVKGRLAFGFYHGSGGNDYVIPLEKTGGEWKVGALAPQEAP
ncbi:MAG: hypothetical protein ACOYD4_09135 [Solirubrobacterales bacterium]